MTKHFIKGGVVRSFEVKNDKVITTICIGGMWVSNPTIEAFYEDGWEDYVAPAQEESERERQDKQNRIYELKGLLQESDYKAIKFAEGELSADEYEPTRIQRRAWREEINVIEQN